MPTTMRTNKRQAWAIWIKSNEQVFKVLGLSFFLFTLFVGVIWALGRDAESIAFVLGCISSTMFGVVEVAHYVEPDRKAVRDMNIEELLLFISSSNSNSDWRRFNTNFAEEAVLLEDPRLRLTIRIDEHGIQNEDYHDPWANKFPDPRATGFWVDITYDRAIFERKILVSIDGGRAMIPSPDSPQTLRISKLDFVIAQLFNASESNLNDYLQRTGITVA